MTLHRKRMRLDGYDYSLPGAYFVTICASIPIPLFGTVHDAAVKLNAIGRIVLDTLRDIPTRHPHVQLDEHIVMPDHLHAILLLNLDNPNGIVTEPTPALPELLQGFKSLSARRYGALRRDHPRLRLPDQLCQRGYYDRIMRNEEDLNEKRAYILTNPQRWVLKHPSWQ